MAELLASDVVARAKHSPRPAGNRWVQLLLTMLFVAWSWAPAGAQGSEPGQPELLSVEPSDLGLRFRCSGPVQSVSGRLDFRGRVVVTLVGQTLAEGHPEALDHTALADLDGSGLVERLTFESAATSSGLQLVTAILVPQRPVTFKVSVEGGDVIVDLFEKVGGTDEILGSTQVRDPESGRRVLTDSDLEPIEAPPGTSGEEQGSAGGASDRGPEVPDALDLGEPGSWLQRLSEAGLVTGDSPTWNSLQGIDSALLSDRELANRERALQESMSRRLETAEQDLRAARAESAELRIALARANQQLELALEQLDIAASRTAELEALLPDLRTSAVESRADLERSRAAQRALTSELDESQRARRRLEALVSGLTADRRAAQSQVASLRIEADALREALQRAEADLATARPTPVLVTQTEPISATDGANVVAAAVPILGQEPVQPTTTEQRVRELLEHWTEAWSAKDIDSYSALYSRQLVTPFGDWESWRQRRVHRLAQPEWIEVEVSWDTLQVEGLSASSEDAERLRVAFQQSYRSPDYQDVVQKVLVLVREADGWRIQREQAAEVVSMIARGQ